MESALCAVWNPSRRDGMASAIGGMASAPQAASLPVILRLSKFCEREASKTEEQSDEGISPVYPLGIMKTNFKSAQRAVWNPCSARYGIRHRRYVLKA